MGIMGEQRTWLQQHNNNITPTNITATFHCNKQRQPRFEVRGGIGLPSDETRVETSACPAVGGQ